MYVCASHACLVPAEVRRDLLGLELKMVVSYHVDAKE